MSKGASANISVALAIIMWPLGAFGFLGMLGDPAPYLSSHQMWVQKAVYGGLPLTAAFAFFVAAAWLSGFSFSAAKGRAIVSLVLCGAFVAFVFWGAVLSPWLAL
jgi:hypothetical protein